MTETLDYVYDEDSFQIRINKLLERSRNNEKLISESEKKYKNCEEFYKEQDRIKRQIENLINELEVEHFLMYGAKGKDPK